MKNRGQETFWSGVDFQLNNDFWEQRGHDAALPFRLMNLLDLTTSLLDLNVHCFLFGGTLRSVTTVGVLVADHDDDIFAYSSQREIEEIIGKNSTARRSHQFTIIRSNPEMVSLERYGRYIDIHLEPLFGSIGLDMTRVHGHMLPLPADVSRVLIAHDARKASQRDSFWRTGRRFLTRVVDAGPSRLFTHGVRKVVEGLSGAVRVFFWRPRPRLMSLAHFLELRIDDPNAVNWDWRGPHWHAVFSPGETFGEALRRLRRTGLPTSLPPNMKKSFDEPMNLSRRFWKSGNNSLLAPLRYGYRHGVVPYMAANLYINREIEPSLYSDEYFESLPPMTDDEISDFLWRNPISVIDGSLTSGRHKATAMLGRLLRGEPYIPVAFQRKG